MDLQQRQLLLDLAYGEAYSRDDFIEATSNATALKAVETWPDWPTGLLIIDGPKGAGKTHLAKIWQARAGAVWLEPVDLWDIAQSPVMEWQERLAANRHAVLDDADQLDDRSLFHLYNMVRERSGSLLLTASAPLGAWMPRLPDLASRLLTAWTVHIGSPQQELLQALLMKQFADRQLRVPAEIVVYLANHMERSFAFAARLAQACDRACWQLKRPLTLPLARTVLQHELAEFDEAAIDNWT